MAWGTRSSRVAQIALAGVRERRHPLPRAQRRNGALVVARMKRVESLLTVLTGQPREVLHVRPERAPRRWLARAGYSPPKAWSFSTPASPLRAPPLLAHFHQAVLTAPPFFTFLHENRARMPGDAASTGAENCGEQGRPKGTRIRRWFQSSYAFAVPHKVVGHVGDTGAAFAGWSLRLPPAGGRSLNGSAAARSSIRVLDPISVAVQLDTLGEWCVGRSAGLLVQFHSRLPHGHRGRSCRAGRRRSRGQLPAWPTIWLLAALRRTGAVTWSFIKTTARHRRSRRDSPVGGAPSWHILVGE